jgi:hypothetical protein
MAEATPSRFASPQMTQALLKKFGGAVQTVSVTMRRCDDVPNFIRRVEQAHQQAAASALRFGPPAKQVR